MGMYWGGLSDRIGRKPVLLLGCAGTMLSMVALGFASNIWIALAGRIVGGALNGNIGVIQTMVGELVSKPEHEPRAYSIMPFVWSIGTIVGPCIGGTFADPHLNWPNAFPRGSLFDRFPYLLPNLICAALLLISIVLGYFLLQETHPDMVPQIIPAEAFTSEETPLRETSDAIKRPAVDVRSATYGTFRNHNQEAVVKQLEQSEKAVSYNIFSNKRIMAVVVSLAIYVSKNEIPPLGSILASAIFTCNGHLLQSGTRLASERSHRLATHCIHKLTEYALFIFGANFST